jgi:hypothetical protein
MLPRVIGLTGRARHGKDTIAGFLSLYDYERIGFADALKEMALAIDPHVKLDWALWLVGPESGSDPQFTFLKLSEVVRLYGWDVAKQQPDVRRVLQKLGTEAIRDIIGEDTWVDIVRRKIDSRIFRCRAVIPDVRFLNEARAVVDMGGEVWRVVRPGYDSGLSSLHPSEAQTQDLPVAFQLVNDGTIRDLGIQVFTYMEGRERQA